MGVNQKRALGTTGTPLTSELPGVNNTGVDNITRAAAGSSLYNQNSGSTDVGGRMQRGGFVKGYFDEKVLGFSTGKVTDGYTRLGQDSFNPFNDQLDFEKIRKDNQSTAVTSVNLLGQFVAKTAVNTVGGVLGGFYGLGSAAVNGDWSKLIDNSFLRGVDQASASVDDQMSVFTSQTDKENGLFGMFSGLETVKSVSDAFAFTAGAVATELIMQTAGNLLSGGVAEAGLPGRVVRYAAGIGRLFSEEGKLGRGIAKAADIVGVGNNLRKIGADAELVSAFIRNADILPNGARIMQKAAMTEGMGMDALQRYNSISRGFEVAGSGTRKVLTGSLYEGSLEGRQAYDSMMQNAEMTIDAQLISEGLGEGKSKREKDYLVGEEKTKRMQAAEGTARSMMLQVAAMNVGLLAVSNAVQFPTLFGSKSFNAVNNVNANSKAFTRTAEGVAEKVGLKGYKNVLSKGVGALKEPGMEFMEETLQGVISKSSQNYHERLTQTKSHTGGMEHPIAEYTEGFLKALGDQYGNKQGIEEGLIGAIVGALGAPSFRRNSKGKIRPTIVGGLASHFSGESEYQKQAISEALEVLNAGTQLSSLKYNLDQSKMNSFAANEKNLAEKNNNKGAMESAGTDDIFQHVAGYLDKGLKGKMLEEHDTLRNMSEEEYTLKTRGEGVTSVSELEKEKELEDYFSKSKTYMDAYEKVFENMRMDKMDDNPLNKKLLSHLAYAVAKDKTELENYDKQAAVLAKKGLRMTPRELYKLAKMHNQLGNFTKKEMEAEIGSLTSDFSRIEFEDYKEGRRNFSDEFEDPTSSKANRKRAKTFLSKLNNADSRKEAISELAKIEKMGSEGVRVPVATMKARELAMKSEAYQKAKDHFSEEKQLEFKTNAEALAEKHQKDNTKQNMRSNIAAAKNFQSTQSQVMRELAGKQERILGVDIEQYLSDIDKYKEQLTAADEVPKAFIDELDSKGTSDINELLQELSDTVDRRENSLRIAANLYGLTGVNKALAGIARAELIASFNNNQLYRNALAHFMKRGGMDDFGGEEAIAYKKLEISLAALKDSREDYNKMIHEEEDNENIQPIIDLLDREISASDNLLEDYLDKIDAEDAKDAADEKAVKESATPSVEKTVEKIKKEIKDYSDEELQEAMALELLLKEHGGLVGSSKTALDLYASEDNTSRDGNLAQLIKDGELKRGSIVYLRPSMDLKLNKGMLDVMTEGQIELYNRGLELFKENSTAIADSDLMNPARFVKDGVLMFDKSDDAALQFFVMTYSVEKEITNDESFDSVSSKKKISQKEGDQRISTSTMLYSPYDSFSQDKTKAIEKAVILAKDAKTLLEMNNSLAKMDPTDFEYLNLNAKRKLLDVSVTARVIKANDATLYELRKQILVGMTLHNASSEKGEPYVMNTYVADFNYGKITEHTVDGEFMANNWNTYPLFDIKGAKSSFTDNRNFLADAASATELFKQDKIYLATQVDPITGKGGLVSLRTGDKFSFNSYQSETGDEQEENKAKIQDKKERKYETGRLYYMHETATGITIPVKLNMNELNTVPDVIDGLKKYLSKAVEEIKENSKDQSEIFKLYEQPIMLEPGDFGGLFDGPVQKPETMHELFKHFAPMMNDTYALNDGKMIIEVGEKGKEILESAEAAGISNPLLDNLDAEEFQGVATLTKKKSTRAKAKTYLNFGTSEKTVAEMDEFAIQEIIDAVGEMRFYFRKSLSIKRAAATDAEKLSNPAVFEYAFTSGLISHGFETEFNTEKIFSKTTEQTTMDGNGFKTNSVPKQASMSIRPMQDGILLKTKAILKKAYEQPAKQENFQGALRRMFRKTAERDQKYPLSFSNMARQTLYTSTLRFKSMLKEELKKGDLPEAQRKKLFKEAVDTELALMRGELNDWQSKTINKNRLTIIKHVNDVLNEFEKFYTDKKNEETFKKIYLSKSKSEHYDELNQLLFNSSEINNDLATILPTITRDIKGASVSQKAFSIDKEKAVNIVQAVMDHVALSKKHFEMGGSGSDSGLPIDISINTLKKDAKGKYNNSSRRLSPILSRDGSITTADNGGVKVYVNASMPMQYKIGNGKVLPFTMDDMHKLTFGPDGKLLNGKVFLLVKGYEKGTIQHLALMFGTNDIVNENSDKSLRYITGMNIVGHDKDLAQNTKEMNAINDTIEQANTAGKYEDTIVDVVSKKMKRSTSSWEDAYDQAMDAAADFMEQQSGAMDALNELTTAKNKGKKTGLLGNLDAEEENDDEETLAAKQAAIDAVKRVDKMNWIFKDKTPAGKEDLEAYDYNYIISTLLAGKEAQFGSQDFESMSFASIQEYIQSLNEGNGKIFLLEAFSEDAQKTRETLVELAKRTKRMYPLVENNAPDVGEILNKATKEDRLKAVNAELNHLSNERKKDPTIKQANADLESKDITKKQFDAIVKKWDNKHGVTALMKESEELAEYSDAPTIDDLFGEEIKPAAVVVKKDKIEESDEARPVAIISDSLRKTMRSCLITEDDVLLKNVVNKIRKENPHSMDIDIFVGMMDSIFNERHVSLNEPGVVLIMESVLGKTKETSDMELILEEYNQNCFPF